MKHFAANYVFDGRIFIKNSRLSFNDDGQLVSVGDEKSGFEEKERMIFYNGIICPYFDAKIMVNNDLPLKNFLFSLGLKFDESTHLPIVLLENVDLQALIFTNETIAKEIY
ncbi:MAG: hypothetical protein IK025_00995 [Bacteroidales bacterium]|nr:hypothetical protein [Bacteroidales bacterium]